MLVPPAFADGIEFNRDIQAAGRRAPGKISSGELLDSSCPWLMKATTAMMQAPRRCQALLFPETIAPYDARSFPDDH